MAKCPNCGGGLMGRFDVPSQLHLPPNIAAFAGSDVVDVMVELRDDEVACADCHTFGRV